MTDIGSEFESIEHVIEAKQLEVRQRKPKTKEPVSLRSALSSVGIESIIKAAKMPFDKKQRAINERGLHKVERVLSQLDTNNR